MHPSRQTDRAHSAGTVLALQQRRLQQILWAVMAAFGTAALMSFSKGGYTSVALELVALALLGLAYWWNQRGELARASRWMLGTLIAGIFSLMATGEGLYDEGVLAFPAILIFAGMFGNRRMLWVLMAWLQGALVLLFVLHQTGVIRAAAVPVDLQRLVMMVAILAAIGFFVWLLTGDLHSTLAQLASEKEALAESHERIDVLAHRDTLTQLPNRTLAKDRLEQLLLQARRDQRMVAALYLDLDNFKTVNDSLGHAVGDELLCLVAERLGSGLRECDTVARLSGDEFLILLGDIQSEEAVTTSAARVLQLLAQPFALQGLDVVVTTSLGIAVAPRDGSDVDELLKNADMAMYRAKDSGRNAFRFFDASMNESVVEHLHMASGLRTALAQGELQVHYQPQFDLHSGRIIGAEALLRWKHPTLGFVPPGKFIPVAERTGLINEVGAWVLQRACLDAKAWRLQGLGELTVAVNVSPLQFHRDNIEREVANALAACQLPASALELELTESLLVADAHHLSEVLQRLRTLGVQIAIDDFGTGYSNLAYLQRFAVHRLKIDQSFVRRMGSNAHDEGIVRAIIEMAHCLGLQVVAEGVEDAAMLHRLQGFGCEFGQGFHWSPALPAEGFGAFVQRHQSAAG
ncbi:MAG: putative bifunctional diguanylate cyclase/phosphodiesterase [Giesbergeria sp.]